MAKLDLPKGSYIDVRFTFESAYDKVSTKGNHTLAPESGKAEVIGYAGFEDMSAVFGKYGADRGKINFFAKLGKAKAAPVAPAPVAKVPAKAKPKAAPAPVEAAPAMDAEARLEAMLEAMLEKKLAAILGK